MKLLLIPESNVVWKTVLQKNFNVVVSENKQKFIKWKYSAQRLVEIIKSFSCPKCLKDGIAIDLDFDVLEPEIPVDSTPVDINAERRRSIDCKFWPDKQIYLKILFYCFQLCLLRLFWS